MSKHNYSQYSNNKKHKPTNDNRAVERVVADPKPVSKPMIEQKPAIEPMVETVETVTLPATVEGVVANCAKLNVRVAPNARADVVCVLNVMSEIEIDVANSTDEWFKVCTATGIEGYCMRKFIEARL